MHACRVKTTMKIREFSPRAFWGPVVPKISHCQGCLLHVHLVKHRRCWHGNHHVAKAQPKSSGTGFGFLSVLLHQCAAIRICAGKPKNDCFRARWALENTWTGSLYVHIKFLYVFLCGRHRQKSERPTKLRCCAVFFWCNQNIAPSCNALQSYENSWVPTNLENR